MVKRLRDYEEVHRVEKRADYCRMIWCRGFASARHAYQSALRWAKNEKLQVLQVKNVSCPNGGPLAKHFEVTYEGQKDQSVRFGRQPHCTCSGFGDYPFDICVHIMYILYNVLNCPEPLRWQLAFLSSEVEDIYRHSYAVSTRLLTDWNGQDALCALCFKAVSSTKGGRTRCITCGRVMHTYCEDFAKRAKKLEITNGCWRCEDETEWGIDKYCEPGRVQYPLVVPGTKAAPQILPGPGRNASQQQSERTTSDAVIIESSGSSRGEHFGEQPNNIPQQASAQTRNSGLAALSNADSLVQVGQTPPKATVASSLGANPQKSPFIALTDVPYKAPGTGATPQIIVTGALSSGIPAGNSSDGSSATGGPPANNPPPPPSGDSALDTTTAPASVTISDSVQAPASVAASVGDTTSTTTNTQSSDDNSAKLARDRGRLAKKSAEMRKRAKREYKRLSKKYKKELKKELNKELKKLRKKSKRELKMLMKESKKLEKRAKGLGEGRKASDDV